MAGSIKIQHGGTASTPQAGFSTLWVKASDGEFYYTKPDGSVESLVGATGAAGAQGQQGATGVGIGLNAKNISVNANNFVYNGATASVASITFASAFTTADYSVDFQYSYAGMPGQTRNWDLSSTTIQFEITNKTSSGFDIVSPTDIPTNFPTLTGYVQAIALGETAVSHYGNFLSTVTQSNAGATAANVVTYNTTDLSSGVSVVSTSRITIANAGVYNIQFSAQLLKSTGGDDLVDIWLAKNGSPVANSNTTVLLSSNPGYGTAAWNFLVQANAGDYYQLYWSSADTTAQLHAAAAGTNPTRPAVPSVILSVTQVSAA